LVQMERMKLLNMTKMENKEVQHFLESQLIKIRKMKMQMIQVASIVNLIQMKLIKVIQMISSKKKQNLN
jgi:hypothetical protein